MEEAFIRAELFIKALQNCSPSTRAADVKAYVTALDKELKIIKREAQNSSLFTSEEDKCFTTKPEAHKFFSRMNKSPSSGWGREKRTEPIPPSDVSNDQQAEKK